MSFIQFQSKVRRDLIVLALLLLQGLELKLNHRQMPIEDIHSYIKISFYDISNGPYPQSQSVWGVSV